MAKHWLPKGWYIQINSKPPDGATWTAYADGIPQIGGWEPTARDADKAAVAALIREAWRVMDQGWTRGRDGRGSVVHLRIKGQFGSICGCAPHLDDGPNTQCMESTPCGVCTQIERGTIAKYVPEVAEMYEMEAANES